MKNYDIVGLVLKFFSLLFVLLLPIRSALVAVGFLTLLDFITGTWASVKEGNKLSSNGFRRTLIKIMAYQATILFGFIMQKYLMDDMPIVNVITGLIGITEGKSFFENIHRITGIDFWSTIVSKLNMPDVKNKSDKTE